MLGPYMEADISKKSGIYRITYVAKIQIPYATKFMSTTKWAHSTLKI